MDNRIRHIRKQRGLTLAELAAACSPPTTAQTIGRLETGMRTLSLDWLDRIAAALDLPPGQLLVDATEDEAAHLTALLTPEGVTPPEKPEIAALPRHGPHVRLLRVAADMADYRRGDLLWFESVSLDRLAEAVNRDILLPGRAGTFHFGRLASVADGEAVLLSPLRDAGSVAVRGFAWAARLRKLIRDFG